MATYPAVDGASSTINMEANGAGTVGDPFRNLVDVQGIVQPATPFSGRRTVTTAGTAVALSVTSQSIVAGVQIKALASNTGIIYVGPSGVSSSNGYELAAGETVFFVIGDLDSVYIDSSVNTEGVTYLAS